MTNVLMIGATSAIAAATARRYAASGSRLMLVARDPARLDILAADLRVRGAERVDVLTADLADTERHAEIVTAAVDALARIDLVLVAHGVLPDQEACERDVDAALESVQVNFQSVVSLGLRLAPVLQEQGSGTFAVISSVAGDRGRQSNFVYGAAKGGLSTFLQGLRNRLWPAGVNVLTIKPGFVKSPMTAHLNGSGPLWAEPDEIADGIVRAVDKRRAEVYLPGFWAAIMLVIRCVPEFIFKRLKL